MLNSAHGEEKKAYGAHRVANNSLRARISLLKRRDIEANSHYRISLSMRAILSIICLLSGFTFVMKRKARGK